MHAALTLLQGLSDQDADWVLSCGDERAFRREDVLLQEGAQPNDVLIVLEGLLEVRTSTSDEPLSAVGPGSLLGEVSFLDGGAASASVVAIEDGIALALPHAKLRERIATAPEFGSALYAAFGRVLAERLRASGVPSGAPSATPTLAGAGPRGEIGQAIEGFKELMMHIDGAAREAGVVPAELEATAAEGFDGLCRMLDGLLGEESQLPEEARRVLGQEVQREMLPYMLLTRLVERIYSKPRGYAGDFMTIEWIYENAPGGTGALGPMIDRLFLDRPAARAVRNRRELLAQQIRQATGESAAVGRVASLACGPAQELFDVFAELEDKTQLKASLLDIDLQALALVSDRAEKTGLKRQLDLHQANLVYLATGRHQLELREQDLIYSIGLIDYFQDRFVIALLNWIHGRLRPGGRAILGNFYTGNPDRGLMDHVLDWKLIHRSEEDMNRLFEASDFGRPCSEILYEPAGVNLFAVGTRS